MAHRVRSVVHTGLAVSDIDAAVRFWVEVLGFEAGGVGEISGGTGAAVLGGVTGVAGGRTRVAFVSRDGVTLELIEWMAPGDREVYRPRPCDVGSWHFALEVEDIDASVAACEPYGYRLLNRIETWPDPPMAGTRLAYVTNDDGTIVEFVQMGPGASGGDAG
jgi:lactoylglutathione lyase